MTRDLGFNLTRLHMGMHISALLFRGEEFMVVTVSQESSFQDLCDKVSKSTTLLFGLDKLTNSPDWEIWDR